MDGIGFVKSKKKISQNQSQYSYFLYHINHFSNKKITTKQKISFFYTKHSYFFSHINQICYSTNPLLLIQFISKHSLMVSAWLPLPRSTTLGSTPPRSYRKRKPGPGLARSQPISPKTPPFMAAGRVSRASQVFCLSSNFFFFFFFNSCVFNKY
jgi:hypothetical protein